MLRKTLTTLILAVALVGGTMARAQETQPPSPSPKAKPPKAPKEKAVQPAPPATPGPKVRPAPPVIVMPRAGRDDQDDEAQAEPLIMKIARNARIAVSSRTVNIRITGIDGDTMEATATSDQGPYPVKAETSSDGDSPKILIYVPQSFRRRAARDVNLNVRLPRYAALESVDSFNGDIDISGIEAPVAVNTNHGAINVARVASLKASTRQGEITAREIKGDAVARSTNGDLTLTDIGGAIDAAATNGSLNVRNAAGDLRANLTVGEVTAECVKGRAEVNTVSGEIQLSGVAGDIEATSTSGEVLVKGRIRPGGRYKLKSISGTVEMLIQPDPPGFTATLTTYSGEIETEFPLKLDSQASVGLINRRVIGRFGDGGVQLTLDAFSGGVRLAKAKPEEMKSCK